MGGATSMNTSESIDVLSDVLLDDERIVSLDEREFLADLLRHSENNPNQSTPEVTRAIARIAGEIVVQRAGSLMADRILRKLTEQNFSEQRHRDDYGLKEIARQGTCNLPPKPPSPQPPNPGPPPKGYRTTGQRTGISSLPPKPPGPQPPNPGPGPGRHAQWGPKGILNSAAPENSELLPPRCLVLEEFLVPAELNDLLSYTLAREEHFILSEVISPGVNT